MDLSLDVVQAYVQGYADRLLDQQLLAVQAGYWSAYYMGKHPQPVSAVSEKLFKSHHTQMSKLTKKDVNTPKPEVDVEGFLAQEARFQAALKARQVRS